MRLPATLLGATLLLSVTAAHADWIVELDSGKQLTVDSYWEEDGTLHLEQDGVTFTLPRARVTNLEKTAGSPGPVDARKMAPSAPVDGDVADGVSEDELLKRDEKTSWRLIRRQLERFVAQSTGADKAALARVEARFRKAQGKYVAVQQELGRVPAGTPKPAATAEPTPPPVMETNVRHLAESHSH